MLVDAFVLAEALPAGGAAILVNRHGDSTLFPAETGVKLTLRAAAVIIATMPSQGSLALVVAGAALACNGGLAPTTCQGICGTVHFRVPPPDSTQAAYVVAYHTFPRSRADLFTFQPPITALRALPLGVDSAFYDAAVEPGRYEWVLAVWVKQGFTLANADTTLRAAGFYRDPADTSRPGIVTVTAQGASAIDFVIDFSQMSPPCRYYSPPCP